MRTRMIVGLAGFLAAGTASWAADKAAPAVDGKAVLERMKGLAGHWRGNVTTEDGPPAEVVYTVTAGGSAVEEKLFPGTPHEMVSMYHLDGGDLVLTHYCAMGNQPRMRLVSASEGNPAQLRFDFAGGTNVDPAKDMHMHAGLITLRGADRLDAEWAVWDKGKQVGANKFFLARAKR